MVFRICDSCKLTRIGVEQALTFYYITFSFIEKVNRNKIIKLDKVITFPITHLRFVIFCVKKMCLFPDYLHINSIFLYSRKDGLIFLLRDYFKHFNGNLIIFEILKNIIFGRNLWFSWKIWRYYYENWFNRALGHPQHDSRLSFQITRILNSISPLVA